MGTDDPFCFATNPSFVISARFAFLESQFQVHVQNATVHTAGDQLSIILSLFLRFQAQCEVNYATGALLDGAMRRPSVGK